MDKSSYDIVMDICNNSGTYRNYCDQRLKDRMSLTLTNNYHLNKVPFIHVYIIFKHT